MLIITIGKFKLLGKIVSYSIDFYSTYNKNKGEAKATLNNNKCGYFIFTSQRQPGISYLKFDIYIYIYIKKVI